VASGPTEQLLQRTRQRLFLQVMVLLALLVVGTGAATVLVGLNALDGDVDRALRTAVLARASAGDGETHTSTPGEDGGEQNEHAPADSDTFILVLDTAGAVVENRSSLTVKGLPDMDAVAAASRADQDLRTVTKGATSVRLLTVAMTNDGSTTGFVQGVFVLTLHDRQSRTLILATLAVAGLGLVAAALITLLVTGRALRPIREGFEAQRQFVADASHELRTPAALIRANAEVLEREGLVSEEGRPFVTDIIGEADRLGGLVGDLLQLAAWDELRMTVSRVPLDAAALAADTVRGASALAAERNVRLELDASGPVPALADRDRLIQLILVLVDNAIDHSPKGGVVTVRARAVGGSAVIDVDDQGPGIPATERERIFEPFTRLSGTTRHGSGGTGLGLAIARRIADAHGGTIVAGSPGGQGARFTVTLPAN
jgi:signal transduction histidine kinase